MGVSQNLYLLLLLAVGAGRLVEMGISRRNRQRLFASGARAIDDPFFRVMVALHTGVLLSAFLEVVLFARPFIPALGYPMLIVFALCNLLRWWVIRTLAAHWNVQVVDSSLLGVVASGPYRFIRHPNYAAVFLELLTLPLIHTAIITAIVGSAAHVWVLSRRIRTEEAILLTNPAYQEAMGAKARFVPGLF